MFELITTKLNTLLYEGLDGADLSVLRSAAIKCDDIAADVPDPKGLQSPITFALRRRSIYLV